MEYYKELFFTKKKHSYDLHVINFYAEDENDIVKYHNVPARGFKLVAGGLLDPVTGYLFHPYNASEFKDMLTTRNIWKNGVCHLPIVFEYIKDGTFKVHLYDDIKDELMEVKVHDKVSLSDSKPGTILRSVDDESYYIYMGMVGQLYVNDKGKGSVKKKHLVLKTDSFDEENNDTVLIVRHFNYVEYNRDKDKSFLKIKDITPENLRIKYYMYGTDDIPLGNYISEDKFDVYEFQKDYPSLLLSSTVRLILTKDDISITRNNIKLEYEYVGETNLQVCYSLKYSSFDSKAKTFYDAVITPTIISKHGCQVDFEKHNYVVEIEDEKYLIAPRRLVEMDCYNSSAKRDFSLFQKYSYSTEFLLYKIDGDSIISRSRFFSLNKFSNKGKLSPSIWMNRVHLYKVEYVLNGHYTYNLFNKPFQPSEIISELVVNDKEVFDIIRANGKVCVDLFGD